MSLYLSRLFLNDHDRQAAADLRSAYSLHQTVRWAFPNAGKENAPLPDGERILWRNDGPQGILVQSVTRPDWDAVLQLHPDYLRDVQVKPFNLTGLQAGQTLAFRLKANVTKGDAHAPYFSAGSSGTHPAGMPSQSPVFCCILTEQCPRVAGTTGSVARRIEAVKHAREYHPNPGVPLSAVPHQTSRGRHV